MARTIKTMFELVFLGALVLGLTIALTIFRPQGVGPSTQPYPLPPDNVNVAENPTQQLPYPSPADSQPTSPQKLTGPTCYTDGLNQFSLQLPTGWRASIPPDINAVGGASIFYNYALDEVESNHGAVELPTNAVKVQITSVKLADDETFEQWIDASIQSPNSSELSKQYTTTTTTPYPYEIAGYTGMAYSMQDFSGTNMLIINLQVDNDRVLIVTIMPASSPALSDALSMLSSLNTKDFGTCSSGAIAPDEPLIIPAPIMQEQLFVMSPQDYTCNLGTFPGNEAHNSLISLQMPFMIGETWIVGGAGSFYGNNHHCNYYNN
jgi:hypothetical protein